VNSPDGGQQFRANPVLQQVSARAGLERERHLDIARVGGEHDDAGVGELRADRDRGLDPVQVRHLEVHQGDVGEEPAELFDRFASVNGLADERDVGFVSDERRDTLP
jgi:hypothetical protein